MVEIYHDGKNIHYLSFVYPLDMLKECSTVLYAAIIVYAFCIITQSLLSSPVNLSVYIRNCTATVGDDIYIADVNRSVVGSDMFRSFLSIQSTILVHVVLLSFSLLITLTAITLVIISKSVWFSTDLAISCTCNHLLCWVICSICFFLFLSIVTMVFVSHG